ncbi:carboxymuconolactone decarboxylase family protein [Massilia sp. IC2-477]|uniref:carboxymuconolactone decarboxylase family protein n=1 Tax=Massilia sp. IC2-477 TaxID=2887198 RepID=UPI001D10611C|nr:carboxymuconolactone decarboxylase family protein [Massilia sp. IC2-477]MCC2957598.1 carboxymuconolactone decarboxylase family protein [Massilia sp. IC2-477]
MDHTDCPSPNGLPDSVRLVAPSLEAYTDRVLLGGVWKRPQLSVRDRSLITLSVLVARNQSERLPYYVDMALDNDVKASELSGLITHLAFYSGWANAIAATEIVQPVFARRGIGAAALATPDAEPFPLDQTGEQRRHTVTSRKFGELAPGLVQLTHEVLFQDLWLQPELTPRDRCLVTISSVIATAQTAQLAFYLNRALDHGVTRAELSELMTHIAFYSGWSSVFTALGVVKDVFEGRPD